MQGIYCQSDESFLNLLRPMFEYMDSLYWIVACQTGPVPSDWIYQSPENERIFDGLHLDVPNFENKGIQLWRPGAMKLVGHLMRFDEWSYFVGFQSEEKDACSKASKIGFPDFSPIFYSNLEREGELCVVQADGWWEFYPARKELHAQIRKAIVSRDIALRDKSTVRPQFL